MRSLESQVDAFLRKNKLVRRGDTVLLAVSGGVDSMVMLRLFARIRELWKLRLRVVHINHQLRGDESDGDEAFVRLQTGQLSIPVYAQRYETATYSKERHLSKQEGARELRYRFFREIQEQTHSAVVATAHHADDNAETVLLNILRGAGVRGLAGIPLRRGHVVRPLLFATRKEIERYADESSVPFRNDSSNASLSYTRNILRHRIIPQLEAKHPSGVVRSLNRVSTIMRRVDDGIQKHLSEYFSELEDRRNIVELDTRSLERETDFMKEQIVLRALTLADVEPTEKKVRSILDLIRRPTGARLSLGKQSTIFRDRERLMLKKELNSPFKEHRVAVGHEYSFPAFEFSTSPPEAVPPSFKNGRTSEFVDADKLGNDLILRSWRRGDWFVPLGFGHKKKLSDYLVDEKVPLFEKSQIPVLVSHGEIVWVCGRRLDDRFKVTSATRKVVRLNFQPHAHA